MTAGRRWPTQEGEGGLLCKGEGDGRGEEGAGGERREREECVRVRGCERNRGRSTKLLQ